MARHRRTRRNPIPQSEWHMQDTANIALSSIVQLEPGVPYGKAGIIFRNMGGQIALVTSNILEITIPKPVALSMGAAEMYADSMVVTSDGQVAQPYARVSMSGFPSHSYAARCYVVQPGHWKVKVEDFTYEFDIIDRYIPDYYRTWERVNQSTGEMPRTQMAMDPMLTQWVQDLPPKRRRKEKLFG
jgi:hypothetical protein